MVGHELGYGTLCACRHLSWEQVEVSFLTVLSSPSFHLFSALTSVQM